MGAGANNNNNVNNINNNDDGVDALAPGLAADGVAAGVDAADVVANNPDPVDNEGVFMPDPDRVQNNEEDLQNRGESSVDVSTTSDDNGGSAGSNVDHAQQQHQQGSAVPQPSSVGGHDQVDDDADIVDDAAVAAEENNEDNNQDNEHNHHVEELLEPVAAGDGGDHQPVHDAVGEAAGLLDVDEGAFGGGLGAVHQALLQREGPTGMD